MGRRKQKNMEEIINKYAESALISAIKLRRYWITQGLSDEEATKRAVKQAIGMLESAGLGFERLLELFYELRNASNEFIKVIENNIERSERYK
ncbi:hypothetical protein [Thermofilum sp.]|jgi:hypothetical protein|uniref:hypothetical protein n=1 Tax=Thermofilum sp. TaxID=1961369 RepID=UPI0025846E34|nr:hypothetical protein [Thermofilum sp.]